jgi:hypothetical protein
MISGKRFNNKFELDDGSGGKFTTTLIGLTLASVPYIVKYAGRNVEITPEGLPLGQSPYLLDMYNKYTAPVKGTNAKMKPFKAVMLMISEQIDAIQQGEANENEYSLLFAQLNAMTAAEGTIGGTAGYNPPYILDALLFIVFVLFLILTLVSDLIPNNNANAIWIAAVVAFCTIAFFQISNRYWNPMALRSKRSGQEPLISKMCVSTEITVTAIFGQPPPSYTISTNPLTEPPAAPAPASTGFRLRFA